MSIGFRLTDIEGVTFSVAITRKEALRIHDELGDVLGLYTNESYLQLVIDAKDAHITDLRIRVPWVTESLSGTQVVR